NGTGCPPVATAASHVVEGRPLPHAEHLAADVGRVEFGLRDSTKDRLARVPRWTISEDVAPYHRVEAVGPHDEIPRDRRRLARDMDRDAGLVLLDRRDMRVQSDGGRIDALRDRGVERRAIHDVSLSAHPPEGTLEVDRGELRSALVAH